MTKEDLLTLLTATLSREGFKRKGNNWVDNSGEISKIVSLQKSEFGNRYYINYGYVIKSLPPDGTKMHIYLQLSTAGSGNRVAVTDILTLDNAMPDGERFRRMTEVLMERLIPELRAVNSEADIKEKIIDGTWEPITPLNVKGYFGLESA